MVPINNVGTAKANFSVEYFKRYFNDKKAIKELNVQIFIVCFLGP